LQDPIVPLSKPENSVRLNLSTVSGPIKEGGRGQPLQKPERMPGKKKMGQKGSFKGGLP
jgi:hypothetical protein